MIKINRSKEPSIFAARVRTPGSNFLTITPHPTRSQWSNHAYWNRVAAEIYNNQNGICAYCGCLIPFIAGVPTIDHQRPKKKYTNLAYEWRNLLLAAMTPNSIKRTSVVLNPYTIGEDWFEIDISTLFVQPNLTKSPRIIKNVKATIKTLKLNDTRYVLLRKQHLSPYIHGMWDFTYLTIAAPFLANELTRQGYTDPTKLGSILPLPPPPIRI